MLNRVGEMSDLKPLSREAIPAALEKAERYRLLNEPGEAESICLDILRADPENQSAVITLLLAVTDRFGKGYGVSDTQTKELLSRVKGDYERAYYTGIVFEAFDRKGEFRAIAGGGRYDTLVKLLSAGSPILASVVITKIVVSQGATVATPP